MALPKVTDIPGGYRFEWEIEKVTITASRLRQHSSDGRVTGEILATTTLPGVTPHLHQASFNFVASRSRKELANTLKERADMLPWGDMLELVCVYVVDHLRKSSPVTFIDGTEEITPQRFLVYPVLPLGSPTVFFGDGGAGKGYVATMLALLTSTHYSQDGLGITVNGPPVGALYLDWESEQDDMTRRIKYLVLGLGLEPVPVYYRRCALPLADDLEQIQKAMADTNSTFIIVDSLGPASGGEVNDANTATRLFGGLRQLPPHTSLLIGHNKKGEAGAPKTILGSVYFTNLARSVWEVRKTQEVGEDTLHVGLFHRKANNSKLFTPLGFEFTFADDCVTVHKQQVTDVEGFVDQLTEKQKIVVCLTRNGPMTDAAISEETGVKLSTVRTNLKRLKDDHQATKGQDETWGLITNRLQDVIGPGEGNG